MRRNQTWHARFTKTGGLSIVCAGSPVCTCDNATDRVQISLRDVALNENNHQQNWRNMTV